MPTITKLTYKYKELYKEYKEFIERNQLKENDILQVQFIYSNRFYNRNCLKCKPELTQEECTMYNLTVDDDQEWILVDNEYGTIYVQLVDNLVIGFRCGEECLKPKNHRFLNQWIVTKNNIPDAHYQLLRTEQFPL